MDVDLGGKARGPLAGIRVLDLTTVVSGPLCAQLLGDFGADVVKVETSGGDVSRHLGVQQQTLTGLFAQYNRNKRSLVLDLKREVCRDALLRLVRDADVFLENYRPRVAERLGIGYETLRRENPRLVYLAISGFGPDGPYADQPAYDMVIQGMSGFAKVLGSERAPRLVSNLVADKTSGVTAAYAVLAALFARERSGAGQRIDVPMLDAFSSFILPDAFSPQTFGGPPADPAASEAVYRAWETADGHVAMLVIEDRQFEAMCKVIDHEELIADERYSTLIARLTNAGELFELFEREFKRRSTAELVERAHRFGAPLGAVNGIDEFLADPQVQASHTSFELDHPAGRMRLFASAPRFSETPSSVRQPPPLLGEHGAEVLREAGFSADEIAELLDPDAGP